MSDALLLKSCRYVALLLCAVMIVVPLMGWEGTAAFALAWIPLPHFLVPLFAPGDRTLVVSSLVYGTFWATLWRNYEQAELFGDAGNDGGMGAFLLFVWALSFAIGLLVRLGWNLVAQTRRKQNARNAA